MVKRFLKHFIDLYFRSSPERYIEHLRKKGMTIGNNVSILSCNKCHIDEGRANFIKIGSNVVICTGVTILGHDYSWYVFKEAFNDILPSGGEDNYR